MCINDISEAALTRTDVPLVLQINVIFNEPTGPLGGAGASASQRCSRGTGEEDWPTSAGVVKKSERVNGDEVVTLFAPDSGGFLTMLRRSR